jgi:hypothetical protein
MNFMLSGTFYIFNVTTTKEEILKTIFTMLILSTMYWAITSSARVSYDARVTVVSL